MKILDDVPVNKLPTFGFHFLQSITVTPHLYSSICLVNIYGIQWNKRVNISAFGMTKIILVEFIRKLG